MPRFFLQLFGRLRLTLDDLPCTAFRSDKARALLAYLAVEAGEPHRREALAGLLWPDYPEASARQSLSQALVSLNRVARSAPEVQPLVHATFSEVQLNGAACDSDVAAFEALLLQSARHAHAPGESCSECAALLEQALSLYVGDLLAGFGVRDSPEFDDWLLVARERLRRQAVNAASALVRWHERGGDGEPAIASARRWVGLDAMDEQAHRAVMRLLAAAGHRSAALAQYESCRRLLLTELRVEPEEATRALYERIRSGELGRAQPFSKSRDTPQVALAELTPSGSSARDNLPACVDSFVGRQRELAEVEGLLRDPAVRLVTLVGAGGMGKTRLALEAARAAVSAFPGGTWLVELAPLPPESVITGTLASGANALDDQPDARAGDRVVRAVASALGVREAGGADSLVAALRDLPVLLLLDNCEHVPGSASRLARRLLGACPGLTVLATSRVPLRLAGEHVYQVLSLSLPPAGSLAAASSENVLGYSAVRLLADRAAAARYGARIDAGNAQAAVAVCRHLDGMPLAIELAAARLSALSLADLAQQLGVTGTAPDGQRWALLESGSRAAHPRQRALLNTVAWSYALLDDAERLLFDRLSVFAGSFTLQAAQALYAGDSPGSGQVPLLLAALVDCSLVQRASDDPPRYRLLETLRLYAAERLAERGETAAIAARLAAYHVGLAEAALPALRRGEPDYARLLRTLDPERDNLAAAIRWSLAEGGGEAALRITGALYPWAESRNLLESYARWAQAALDLTEDRAQVMALPRAQALEVLADYYEEWQLSEDKWRACRAMLAAAEATQDRLTLARALYWEGTCARAQGDRPRGRELQAQALAIAQACGEPNLALRLGRGLLRTLLWEGTMADSEHVVAVTPEGYRARACSDASHRALNFGELAQAEQWAREGTDRYLKLGSPGHAGATMRVLAEIVAYQGRLDEADALFAEGSRLCKENGDEHALMMMLSQRCEYAWLGMRDTARGYAEACLQERYGLGERGYGTLNRQRLARAAFGIGERDLGWRLLQEATYERMAGDPDAAYFGAEARGWDAFLTGDMGAAAAAFRTALDVALRSHWRIDAANTTERLAWPLAALREMDEAASLLAEAELERAATGLRLFPVEIPQHERALALAGGRPRPPE